jgi:hypothetical protein
MMDGISECFGQLAKREEDFLEAAKKDNHPAVQLHLEGEIEKYEELRGYEVRPITRADMEEPGLETDVKLEPPGGDGIVIDTPPRTGVVYVDEIFSLPFAEQPDEREWSEDEELRELQAFAIMGGESQEALDRLQAVLTRQADRDVLYLWIASVHERRGDTASQIAILEQGLAHARTKISLSASLGNVYLDADDLRAAVGWWTRSCVLQLGGGQANESHAFLNLSAICSSLHQYDAHEWLLAQADRINPRRIRFQSRALDLRHEITMRQADDGIVSALRLLYEYYAFR